MPALRLISVLLALATAGAATALAQNQPPPLAPAPARPYKALAIMPPKDISDAELNALRGQIGEAAKRRDRAALARLVVARGFFWERENGDSADKRKSGIDNLAAGLGLNNKHSVGWDILAGYAEDPIASASPAHKGAVCAPADPEFDGKAFDDLLRSTQTEATEWGYPVSAGIEVHTAPQANAPVIEKLGLNFVRVMPEARPASAAYLRVATPGGKTGYVSVDAIAPLGNDQICYVKEAGSWKIGGYIGGGE
jgi:hypothetical protein